MANAWVNAAEREVLRPKTAWFFFPKPVLQQMRLLSTSAQSVLLFVLSFTAGEHRLSAPCARSLIQTNTGIGSPNTVSEALRELVRHGLLFVVRDRTREGRPIQRVSLAGPLAACYQAEKRAPSGSEADPQGDQKSRGSKEEIRTDLQETSSSVVKKPFDDDVSLQVQVRCEPGEPDVSEHHELPSEPLATFSPKPHEVEPRQEAEHPEREQFASQLLAKPFGFSRNRAEQIAIKFEGTRIRPWLDYILGHPEIKNPAGYLTRMLEQGAQVPMPVRRGVMIRPHRPELVETVRQMCEVAETQPTEPVSLLDDLDEASRAEIRQEARRRVARLMGKVADAVSETSPAVEALMLTVAEERMRAVAA